MKLFGLKSILLSTLIQIIIVCLFIKVLGTIFFIIETALFILLFFRILSISDNKIKIYFPFPIKRQGVPLNEIKKIIINDGGLATGFTTISFFNFDNVRVKEVFMQMYPFERRQLAKYLDNKGIVVDGNGI